MPPLMILTEDGEREVPVRLRCWVRLSLVLITLGVTTIFAIAAGLDPYRGGKIWLEETHRQLLLPPCTFKVITGLPCPSCGMTSSFALLVRADLWNSLQANACGTFLAGFLMVLAPWSLGSALAGRLLFVRQVEVVIMRLLTCFLFLMFVRWGLVLWLNQ